MEHAQLQAHLREQLGLRVGPETAQYILKRLQDPSSPPIPILAADARTGVPLKTILSPDQIPQQQHS